MSDLRTAAQALADCLRAPHYEDRVGELLQDLDDALAPAPQASQPPQGADIERFMGLAKEYAKAYYVAQSGKTWYNHQPLPVAEAALRAALAASPPPAAQEAAAISRIDGYIGPPTLDRVLQLQRGDALYVVRATEARKE